MFARSLHSCLSLAMLFVAISLFEEQSLIARKRHNAPLLRLNSHIKKIYYEKNILFVLEDRRLLLLGLSKESLKKSEMDELPLIREKEISVCASTGIQFTKSAWLVPTQASCTSTKKAAHTRLWNWKENRSLALSKASGFFRIQGLSPDARFFAGIRDDGSVLRYKRNKHSFDLVSQTKLARMGLGSTLVPVGMDPYLRFAAVWDWKDYYLHIYDLHTGKTLHKNDFYIPEKNKKRVILSFSPDGKFYFDGKRIRSLADGQVLASLPRRHCCILKEAVWSADSKRLALLIEYDEDYLSFPLYARFLNTHATLPQKGAQSTLRPSNPAWLKAPRPQTNAHTKSVAEIYSIQRKTKNRKPLAVIKSATSIRSIAFADPVAKNTLLLLQKTGVLKKTSYIEKQEERKNNILK